MNQHHVQKAYLKKFEIETKLWVYVKETETKFQKPASRCTIAEDFQPEEFEKFQNSEIETPGIRKLRKIDSDEPLTHEDAQIILYWTALHCIRNENYRKDSGENYEIDFYKLLDTEKLFNNYFRFIFTYKSPKDHFFITSDNPIIEFYVDTQIVRVLTLSPSKALVFTPIDDYPTHSEVGFSEMINSMLYSTCYKEVYSNQESLPISKYKNNIKRWNLKPVPTVTEFTASKKKNE